MGWGTASEIVYSHGMKINMPAATATTLKTSMRGQDYTLVQCHLHWGSEHTFNGVQDALCMHCVHTKDVVPEGGRSHGVLGFTWEVGDTADPFLNEWIHLAPLSGEDAVTNADIDMTLAFGGMNLAHYWQYDGGLTTPPCSEVVDWHVLMDKRVLTQAQLGIIVATTDVDVGNFRRPMPLNGRNVMGCEAFTESWSWPEDNRWNTVQFSVCGTGMEQSPIDLRSCDQIEARSDDPIVAVNWGTASDLVYSHGIKINMPGGGYQTSMRGLTYTMVQCHLHWGSEHFIDGMQGALCMHCVHTKDVVPPGGRMYGVLGLIWDLGESADPFLTQWITDAPAYGGADVLLQAGDQVDMNLALQGMNLQHYWQYDGGLTTPPCSEAVDWHVLMEKRSLSQSQLDTIREKTGVDGGNFRRPQNLNDRQVLGCVGGQGGSDLEQESDGASHRGLTAVLSILMFLSFC
jgi:carbonic anhydrase